MLVDQSWGGDLLWHTRFGHVNFQVMELMSKEVVVLGIPKLIHPKKMYEGCLMSKQIRKSFPFEAVFTAKQAIELIHGDICGPIFPPTSW